MDSDELRELRARLAAHEYILEILCGQLWTRISPQDVDLMRQRYLRLLREDQSPDTEKALTSAEQILRNALIRASEMRSTL